MVLKCSPTLDVDCRGFPRECGEIIGESLSDRIHGASDLLFNYEAFRILQPWWMPYWFYLYCAQWRASDRLAGPVRVYLPAAADRLEGMAQGARVGLESLYLFHAMESATSALINAPAMPLAACTALGVGRRRSATGNCLLHHNFDNIPLARPMFVIRRRRERGRFACLEFGLAPLAGAIDGINEHGLSITYNFAWTTSANTPAPSVSMAVGEALACCRNVPEAIAFLTTGICSGGSLLMLADDEGAIARLEIAGDNFSVVRGEPDAVMYHSNTYRAAPMKQWEVDAQAMYTDWAPAALTGRRVLESPLRRDARLEELLSHQASHTPDDVARLMSDHGVGNRGDENTVCMHGSYWETLATVQLLPAERAMRLSYTAPCRANFSTFAL